MSALIFKVHPAFLFLVAFLDIFSLYILDSNLDLLKKLSLFALCIVLHFVFCLFEYWRIKTEQEVELEQWAY